MLSKALTPAEIGKVLAKLRMEKPNLKIRELAELVGISPSYASKLLKHEREDDEHSTGNP